MRRPKAKLFLMIGTLMSIGCTHSLHIAQYSDFGPTYAAYQKGTLVKGEAEQFVILGFVAQTDFVNLAFHRLERACPDGHIQGIETQYSTDHGFFSWTNHVRMQGLCLRKTRS